MNQMIISKKEQIEIKKTFQEWNKYKEQCNENADEMSLDEYEVGCVKCDFLKGSCCCNFPLIFKLNEKCNTTNPWSLYYHKKKYSVELIDNILESKYKEINLIQRYIMA